MKKTFPKLKKFFSRKLTLMVVPHNTFQPLKLHFTFSFATFLFLSWTGLTSWATWAVVTNIDYWSMRVNHQVLKFKVHYFATEMKKSRELTDQVREVDLQLRKLLEMKNRQSILQAEPFQGQGGIEPFERSILEKEINKRLWEINDSEIREMSNAFQKESQVQLESYKEISEHIAYERGLYRSTPRGWPATGRSTSHFGHRLSPFHGGPQFHTGIDIANERGTPIHATANGLVQVASWEGGYGRLVVIDHGFGYRTYYGHNSQLLVQPGQRVKRNQIIAYMGSSGSSTGNHTHYEVWYNGRPVNPWRYLVTKSFDDFQR